MSYIKRSIKMNENRDNRWQVVSLDVWGDADDWHINDVFNTGKYIEVSSQDTEEDIMRKLRDISILRIKPEDYGIFEDEDTFTVYDRNDVPVFELRSPSRHIL